MSTPSKTNERVLNTCFFILRQSDPYLFSLRNKLTQMSVYSMNFSRHVNTPSLSKVNKFFVTKFFFYRYYIKVFSLSFNTNDCVTNFIMLLHYLHNSNRDQLHTEKNIFSIWQPIQIMREKCAELGSSLFCFLIMFCAYKSLFFYMLKERFL